MKLQLVIRPAVRADLPEIRRFDSHIPPERLLACIDSGFVFVLCVGEATVGVCRWNLFWQSIPFLDLLYLDEGYRGIGYGTAVMAYWENTMAERGFRHVMLSTQEDETAKFFYEKLGYHPAGSFLPPEQTAPELIYVKDLPPQEDLIYVSK